MKWSNLSYLLWPSKNLPKCLTLEICIESCVFHSFTTFHENLAGHQTSLKYVAFFHIPGLPAAKLSCAEVQKAWRTMLNSIVPLYSSFWCCHPCKDGTRDFMQLLKISLYSGQVKRQKRIQCIPKYGLKRFLRMQVTEMKNDCP